MKDPLGVSPSKGNQGTTRGKEKFLLTSVGIEPTTSGLDRFFSVGQKNLVNSENKEKFSNYQLFSRITGSAMVSINFGAGNFGGRQPGTSALRMLLRLTAVNR